jgi:Rieske Fe-S protein
MGTNAAKDFSNPVDGSGSILVHLSNGNFVAYNKACTHAGVPVYYDSGSQQLKCPAHGAIFDPANNGKPLAGPANGPLQNITIRVNSDGTITTG